MKNIIISIGLVLAMVGCAEKESQFLQNCTQTITKEGSNEERAVTLCTCADGKLAENLSKDEIALATEIITLDQSAAKEKYADTPSALKLIDKMEEHFKSCG